MIFRCPHLAVVLTAFLIGCERAPAPAPPAAPPPAAAMPSVRVLATGPVASETTVAKGERFTVVEMREGDRLRLAIPAALATIDLVKLPAGSIEMPVVGRNGKLENTPTQAVHVGPLWMATTETTSELYDAFLLEHGGGVPVVGADGSTRPSSPYKAYDSFRYWRHGYAAINLTLPNCRAFCAWLSAKTGRIYRMPTEAEWEYACRAGGAAHLSKVELLDMAWVRENADGMPHPVAMKRPNRWGLYDMLGGVGEWVTGVDGQAVQKGGSWLDPADHAIPSFRVPFNIEWQMTDPSNGRFMWLSDGPHVGFRLVREVD